MKDKIRECVENLLFDDELPLTGERAIKEIVVHDDTAKITIGVDGENSPMERFDLEDRLRSAVLAMSGLRRVLITSVSLFESRSESLKPPKGAKSSKAPVAKKEHSLPPKTAIAGVSSVYMVCSAKGGVGKSTVALNTALALKLEGYNVGLLDLDIYGPSLCALIGTETPPQIEGDKIVPPKVFGISVLSIAMMMDRSQPLIWRGPMVASVINQLLFEVDWSGLDFLIIDMPPGTGDSYLSLLQSIEVDGAVIVTTPSELALADVTRGAGLFEPFDVKILGVVENMASYAWPGADDAIETLSSITPSDQLMANKLQKIQDLLQSAKYLRIFGDNTERYLKVLNLELIASLPLDTELQAHNDAGAPYMEDPKNADIMKAFLKIARFIADDRAQKL